MSRSGDQTKGSRLVGNGKLLIAIVGAVFVIGALLYFTQGGGATYDSAQELADAIGCDLESGPPEGGTEVENALCTGAEESPRGLGIRVFHSDDAYEEFEEEARDGAFVQIIGENWAVATGEEDPIPPNRARYERLAERLGGEVVGGAQ
jgi:hypothetical protein